MSYDIGLHKIINGDGGICTPGEAQACNDLLRTVTTDTPDEFNFLVLDFEDGSSVEVSIWNDENAVDGCTFFTRGISKPLIDFIFNLAVTGNFVILDTGGSDTPESPMAIMPSDKIIKDAGADTFEHPRLCTSAAELAEILGVSFNEWADYRDHVVATISNETTLPPQKTPFFKRLFSKK